MNLFEKIIAARAEGKPMPLKGHTKITLTDVETGKEEIVESDNMVTAAVADILASNFCGLGNYSSLMPLKNLFSGLMLFQNNIEDVAGNYAIPSDLDNPMIGHAGPTAHSTASIYRGNPNGGESQQTNNSIKFVWDFATNQGNGTINCVCLVPGTMGNMGIKPFDDTQNPVYQFGQSLNYNAVFNEAESIKFPFEEVGDRSYYSIYIDGTTFKENNVEHDLAEFGVVKDKDVWRVKSTRTATVRSGNNRFVCQAVHDNQLYYYVIRALSGTSFQIDRIQNDFLNYSAFVVDTMDITCSDTSFYTGNIYSRNGCLPIFAMDGDYLYYPNNTKTKFYKINIYNPADVTLLDGDAVIDYGQGDSQYTDGQQFANPLWVSNGLIVGNNYIINGNKVYPIKRLRNIGCDNQYFAYQNPLWLARRADANAAVYGNGRQTYSTSYRSGQVCVLFPYFLSTINNLQDEVVKTTSKTMKVEYTITEA